MKEVRFTEEAFNQIAGHPYLTEDLIIGIVKDSILEDRKYEDSDHFHITFPRKKNKKWINVTVIVHEKPHEFLVYGIHSGRVSS